MFELSPELPKGFGYALYAREGGGNPDPTTETQKFVAKSARYGSSHSATDAFEATGGQSRPGPTRRRGIRR